MAQPEDPPVVDEVALWRSRTRRSSRLRLPVVAGRDVVVPLRLNQDVMSGTGLGEPPVAAVSGESRLSPVSARLDAVRRGEHHAWRIETLRRLQALLLPD
jgi:hypothetical protein